MLLVLPTAVLGGLLWRQLEEDHQTLMAAAPGDTADAARRLLDALEHRVRDLVDREGLRPFYHYKKSYFPPGTIGSDLAFVPSPLATGPAPEGIQAWFTYSFGSRGVPDTEIFAGGRDRDPAWPDRHAALESATVALALHDRGENWFSRIARLGAVRVDLLPLPVAAVNASQEQDIDCMRSELHALKELQDESQDVQVFSFHLRFYREEDGTPRVVASRRVIIESNKRLRGMPSCFENLAWGMHQVQGFFIDPDWLFARLPATLANQVLDPSQEFVAAGTGPSGAQLLGGRSKHQAGAVGAEIRPVKELGLETYAPEDENFGRMRVMVDTGDLEARFRSQTLHFLGLAAMLVFSLGTGLALLLRSVRRDLEAAQRTENFVAAVTHELRTPLSAIRMHGEMLQDGWVKDDSKRQEYYRRIVRETDRLETLVERVLEKSRLSTGDARPEPGDLNEIVEGLGPALLGTGTEQPARDVVFDLAPDLPETLIVPDGVRSIVTNLVENARKYAPVREDVPGAEPIRVVTLRVDGEPALEVRDRGPGIPREEHAHIFDAFYRVGNETTRTSKGTGLGLHLVALHCRAMGARIQALDREGGGTVFRVTFRRAGGEERLTQAS